MPQQHHPCHHQVKYINSACTAPAGTAKPTELLPTALARKHLLPPLPATVPPAYNTTQHIEKAQYDFAGVELVTGVESRHGAGMCREGKGAGTALRFSDKVHGTPGQAMCEKAVRELHTRCCMQCIGSNKRECCPALVTSARCIAFGVPSAILAGSVSHALQA
jgi:hypothetical protein